MALKTFNVGDVLGAADVTEYLENCRFAVKPADTQRVNNVTLTADPDLVLLVDANKTYQMDLMINYHGLGGADLKFGFGAPAGCALNGLAFGPDLSVSGATGPFKTITYDQWGATLSGARSNGCRGVGVEDTVWVRGILINGGTSGNVVFQWCQNATSATGTWVIAGSYMILRRVA